MVTTLIVENETLKVKEVSVVILDDKKFKKTSGDNNGGAFIANLSHSRSNSHENNSRSKSNLRPRVVLTDKKCFYCHEMDHIQYICKKTK